MKDMEHDLRAAFPAMPEECRAALSDAARSVKEEEGMKRKYPVAILVAAILTLMTTIAIAEGWNVLSFLGLDPDSDAQTLVQPVSASAKVDNCTIRIDSAITDGEYLAFDYVVTSTKPETPIYLWVEQFTANGETIWTDGTDDFDHQWMPGYFQKTVWQDGEWIKLPDGLTGDTLHVEMVVGVYTPNRPVWYMDEFDREIAAQKLAEGWYVLAGGKGLVFNDPVDGIIQGHWASVDADSGVGLTRSEMKVTFDLDLKAARTSVRTPELPSPVTKDGATLAVSSITISPLQTHIVATFTPENASYEDIVDWSDGMNFAYFDLEGHELKHFGMCLMPMGDITVEEAEDGTWYRKLDYNFIEVYDTLPDTILLAYTTEDGFRIDLPISVK